MRFIFLFICLWHAGRIISCDICGAYMGLTPYTNRNTVSFLHRYRVFNGYKNYQSHSAFFPNHAYRVMHGSQPHDSLLVNNNFHSAKDFQSYKTFELRAKVFVKPRFELNLFVPLLNNKSLTDNVYLECTGLGDISANIGYHMLLPKEGSNLKQKLISGIGLKIPTGNFYVHDKNSERISFELQPGTGSFDGLVYLSYTLVTNKIGCSSLVNAKYNGTNIYKEKVGNSLTHFFSLFYKLSVKQLTFYPSIQSNYEYTRGLFINHQLQTNTGMNVWMIGPGLDTYYKNFSLNMGWHFTASEHVASGELYSAGRLSLGLNYSFGGK